MANEFTAVVEREWFNRLLCRDSGRQWPGAYEGGGPPEPLRRCGPDSWGPSWGCASGSTGGCHQGEGHRQVKRGDLLRHLRRHGCYLKREGTSHSLWCNPATGAVEAIPRRTEISKW